MISSQCNADKGMRKDGFHQGGADTYVPKIGSRQSRCHLHSRENPNNRRPNGRREPMDEFFRGGEP